MQSFGVETSGKEATWTT